jgi:hypothetical protein
MMCPAPVQRDGKLFPSSLVRRVVIVHGSAKVTLENGHMW